MQAVVRFGVGDADLGDGVAVAGLRAVGPGEVVADSGVVEAEAPVFVEDPDAAGAFPVAGVIARELAVVVAPRLAAV